MEKLSSLQRAVYGLKFIDLPGYAPAYGDFNVGKRSFSVVNSVATFSKKMLRCWPTVAQQLPDGRPTAATPGVRMSCHIDSQPN
jgi:hypothetical protein